MLVKELKGKIVRKYTKFIKQDPNKGMNFMQIFANTISETIGSRSRSIYNNCLKNEEKQLHTEAMSLKHKSKKKNNVSSNH